ncbi:AAA family ATPase [Parvibium lacunae]|uniref:ATP-binding protein n=1 Tax=Parvibium lacunae TaxID=1888893 RepID=A0A368KZE6_9BURK|nr:ATP-binding protein [Parvibium lacunae]RCS56474.1 ATP-binding protein [Parvibium lacunae]
MATLIFFCGHAGTGKTTIARRMTRDLIAQLGQSFCFLDKDTLYGNYSSAVMGALTGNPNDRDSPTYLNTLRDPEYQALLDTARENLQLGIHVIVVGPLSREIKQQQLFDPTWLRLPAGCNSTVVWVEIDEETAKQRIIARADKRDEYKLAHWEDYRQRRFSPARADYPKMIFFDNTAPTVDDYAALQRQLAHKVRSA